MATVFLKQCSRCNLEKALDAFPKQRTYCKKCWYKQCRPAIARWVKNHPEKMRAYSKEWKEKNEERVRVQKKKHRKEILPELNKYNREYRAKNKAIKQAHDAVKYAKKIGKLVPRPCEVCGSVAHAHHSSYEKNMRLVVKWLCPQHHSEAHSCQLSI